MNTFEDFHEVERIILKAENHLGCKLLYDLMKSLSFCIDDDFFTLTENLRQARGNQLL